jgi:hypothetical protein
LEGKKKKSKWLKLLLLQRLQFHITARPMSSMKSFVKPVLTQIGITVMSKTPSPRYLSSFPNQAQKEVYTDGQEILYYCEREADYTLNDSKLVFHRGDKSGPVMATAVPCPYQKYQTDIHFVTPNLTVPLKHKHHAHYTQRDHQFHLHGHHDTGFIGKFHPSVFKGNRQTITGENAQQVDMQDLVLVTAMTTQERGEEMKGKGTMAWQRAAELGIAV